jgi:hypothetical protein
VDAIDTKRKKEREGGSYYRVWVGCAPLSIEKSNADNNITQVS